MVYFNTANSLLVVEEELFGHEIKTLEHLRKLHCWYIE